MNRVTDDDHDWVTGDLRETVMLAHLRSGCDEVTPVERRAICRAAAVEIARLRTDRDKLRAEVEGRDRENERLTDEIRRRDESPFQECVLKAAQKLVDTGNAESESCARCDGGDLARPRPAKDDEPTSLDGAMIVSIGNDGSLLVDRKGGQRTRIWQDHPAKGVVVAEGVVHNSNDGLYWFVRFADGDEAHMPANLSNLDGYRVRVTVEKVERWES